MVLQTVSRGKCLVVGNEIRLGSSGTLEDSSALIAQSDSGLAFWNVAKSDPRHKDNLPGMSGDFDRFAVNAKLFYVVFGSYAKNAPTYTTTTIEEYLQNLNGGATILWYKDGCYDGVSVTAQGEITLAVTLDGRNTTGFSGSKSSGVEPVPLSHYLSVSSAAQTAAAFPSSTPQGEEPQSLFDMLEEGQDTAPAETSLVVLDRDQTTLNDMQNLQDILLLKSFISVNAMSLMYKRRENKAYNLDDKVEAAQYVIDMANALNEVTSKSMGGFLNPKQSTAYSYEKSIIGAEVHSEILNFLFSSFNLPEKALAQIDGLLSTANSKLSANIKNTHTTLNHMIYVFTFEPVEGLESVKLPVLRQLYLKIDQKSWEASVKVGKSSASITKFSFKMNVVDSQWGMNPGQVERQRTQIEDLLTNMTSANLDQINELASPSVIDSGSVTSSATFQITGGELRFHQPPSANVITGNYVAFPMEQGEKKFMTSPTTHTPVLYTSVGTWHFTTYELKDVSGNYELHAHIKFQPKYLNSKERVGLVQVVRRTRKGWSDVTSGKLDTDTGAYNIRGLGTTFRDVRPKTIAVPYHSSYGGLMFDFIDNFADSESPFYAAEKDVQGAKSLYEAMAYPKRNLNDQNKDQTFADKDDNFAYAMLYDRPAQKKVSSTYAAVYEQDLTNKDDWKGKYLSGTNASDFNKTSNDVVYRDNITRRDGETGDKTTGHRFEVAALKARDDGTTEYLGSVSWGWGWDYTNARAYHPWLISKNNKPTDFFMKAAQAWNDGCDDVKYKAKIKLPLQ